MFARFVHLCSRARACIAVVGSALSLTHGHVFAQPRPDIPPPGAIPPAAIDNTLQIEGENVRAKQINTRMFVPVLVDGHGPYRFLVDSGADRSVVGSALAVQLALPVNGASVKLNSIAGPSQQSTVRIDRLTIGASEIANISAPALPEAYLGAQGLIGIDALAEQRLMLDFEKKTVTVQDARRPAPEIFGEIVVTARRRKGQLILTQASVGGTRTFAVIDTGAEMTMGNSALAARVLGRRHPPVAHPVTLIGVTGASVTANLVILPDFEVGGITLSNVPVAFADVAPFALFGLSDQPALLLGTDVLETFRRVSLDFRRRKVRFGLRR